MLVLHMPLRAPVLVANLTTQSPVPCVIFQDKSPTDVTFDGWIERRARIGKCDVQGLCFDIQEKVYSVSI